MLSYRDVTAWIRHLPSIEVAMPKTTISASAKLTDTARVDGSLLSGTDHPDKATAVVINFMKTIFNEGAHNWSSEEREKRINACLAESAAYQKAGDKQDLEALSNKIREQIEAGEFQPPSSREETKTPSPEEPLHPQDMRHAIKALAESIEFD